MPSYEEIVYITNPDICAGTEYMTLSMHCWARGWILSRSPLRRTFQEIEQTNKDVKFFHSKHILGIRYNKDYLTIYVDKREGEKCKAITFVFGSKKALDFLFKNTFFDENWKGTDFLNVPTLSFQDFSLTVRGDGLIFNIGGDLMFYNSTNISHIENNAFEFCLDYPNTQSLPHANVYIDPKTWNLILRNTFGSNVLNARLIVHTKKLESFGMDDPSAIHETQNHT